jgi:hypothetical protein
MVKCSRVIINDCVGVGAEFQGLAVLKFDPRIRAMRRNPLQRGITTYNVVRPQLRNEDISGRKAMRLCVQRALNPEYQHRAESRRDLYEDCATYKVPSCGHVDGRASLRDLYHFIEALSRRGHSSKALLCFRPNRPEERSFLVDGDADRIDPGIQVAGDRMGPGLSVDRI